VVAVPKDFRRVRIISCEPLAMQFMQQGAWRAILTRCRRFGPEFRDQSRNGNLSNHFEKVATIDLSDASDSVSQRIVEQLFPSDWFELLAALRSEYARMPDGTLVEIGAFAPMGSAICFPVESISFWALAHAIQDRVHLADTLDGLTSVYGDDIIVPFHLGKDLVDLLTRSGFRPNMHKCCISDSPFRESCGAEWWAGEDVTVVRPKSLKASQPGHSETGVLPMVGHANRLYQRGFEQTSQLLAWSVKLPVSLGYGPLQANPALKWPVIGAKRWNRSWQRLEQRVACCKSIRTEVPEVALGIRGLFMGLCSGWTTASTFPTRTKVSTIWLEP